jgi:hypothetical protein
MQGSGWASVIGHWHIQIFKWPIVFPVTRSLHFLILLSVEQQNSLDPFIFKMTHSCYALQVKLTDCW